MTRTVDAPALGAYAGLAPTGVGKTYLACALGQNAYRNGYRVIYRRAPRLIDELRLARADGTLPRLLTRLGASSH